MTLKEQFIEYFDANGKCKINEIRLISNQKCELLVCIKFGICLTLDVFNENMKLKKEFKDIHSKNKSIKIIEDICRNIKIKKLEKQMLEETKHLSAAKTKLQKF